jgi:uncharacterized membrane protein YwzB
MTEVTIGSIFIGAMCIALSLWIIRALRWSKNFKEKEVKQ